MPYVALIVMSQLFYILSPVTKEDLALVYATECFVRESVIDFKPPKKAQSLLVRASSSEFAAREEASDQLKLVDPRWLIWGMWSNDSEVRARCVTAMRFAAICKNCMGAGYCLYEFGENINETRNDKKETIPHCKKCYMSIFYHGELTRVICKPCNGFRNVWSLSYFDGLANKVD